MKLALYQMASTKGDVNQNIESLRNAARDAAEKGCELLVIPEFWASGYDISRINQYASPLNQGIFDTMRQIAREYRIALCGSSPEKAGQDIFNTAVIFSETGDCIDSYQKIHLFKVTDEHQYLKPGQDVKVVKTPWGNIGLAICFDLRFPELFRMLALEGADIVLVPAYWPQPRLHHWRLFLQARAIENQMFMAGCNRSAIAGKLDFGYSAVIDPAGEILIEAGKEEILLTADVDLKRVGQVRDEFPLLSSRRSELYEI